MQTRRGYHQHCGLAKALDVVGERWTLLVVRDLLLGPRRYGDLVEALPGIGTNLLAKRLRELEDVGVVEKVLLPPPANAPAYRLTDAGRELEPAVHALARWGGRFLGREPKRGDRTDVGWLLLSIKRRYRPAAGVRLAVRVRSGGRVFRLDLGEHLDVREGDDAPAPLTITGEMWPIALFFHGRASVTALERAGSFALEGDRAQIEPVLRAFGDPPLTRSLASRATRGRSSRAR